MIKPFLVLLLIAFSATSFSQSSMIEITGAEGKRVGEVAEEFNAGLDSSGVLGKVYVYSNGNVNEYYFGFAIDRDSVSETPPSYYFVTPSGLPVLVYTGYEKFIKMSKWHRKEIDSLVRVFLFPTRYMPNIHYNYWYLRFEKGKEIEFTKRIERSRLRSIPKWLK